MHDFPVLEIGSLRFDLSTYITIIVSCVIVFVLARLAIRNLSVTNPSKMQNFMEWIVDFVHGMIASTMEISKARAYLSLGLTLILFIFVSNLLGLPFGFITSHQHELTLFGYPIVAEDTITNTFLETGHGSVEIAWWKSPTADLSVTAGLAVVVFFLTHYLGATRNTKHYFKHFFEPYWFFLPLNIIKELSKPLTLSLRLYANIFAGEVLIATILMAGVFGLPLLVAWQGFSIFVGGIQAFLFTILSMVYISQTTVHEEKNH